MSDGKADGGDRTAIDGQGGNERGRGRDGVAVAPAHGNMTGDGRGAAFDSQVRGGFGTRISRRKVTDADAAAKGVDLTFSPQHDGTFRNGERIESGCWAVTVRADIE